jgi:UPF0755 protein
MKRVGLLFLTILLISVATGMGIIWTKIKSINTTELSNAEATEFEITKGASLYQVVDKLRQYADIDEFGFKVWLQFHPELSKIQSGVYEIPPKQDLVEVLSLFASGKVKQMSVTLLEGQTIYQWLNTLSQAQGINHDIVDEDSLYVQMGINNYAFCTNQYNSVEGCLLPDTYFYTHGTYSSELLSRALSAMQIFLDEVWPSRFADIPIKTQYEALILASIIEKETAIESERGEIAGVFVNRLNSNMRLQTDPTVIYGIGKDYDGDITRAHLRTPTPYNTYVIRGLPITPIAMPNKASILAALLPELTDSLYFVATGNGGHQFSTNLQDHNKAVRAYLKQRKENLNSNEND